LLIMPVGRSRRDQDLVLMRRQGGATTEERRGGVVFVDLVGAHGW
jgi:protein-L-isoaspartate(D-aspartate) O-methyltransferase